MNERRSGEATPTLAHERTPNSTRWVNPQDLAVAHDAWCADAEAQAALEDAVKRREPAARARHQRITTRADVLAVLGRLTARANPQTRIADLTYSQLEVVTAIPKDVGIPTVFSIAMELGLVVNVTKAGKPITQGGAGRAPKRRLAYLDPYLERIASDVRHDSELDSCRDSSGIVSACRPPLSNPLTNNAADEADNAGHTWSSNYRTNVIGHLKVKLRTSPRQVREQYGTRIALEAGRLANEFDVIPPNDPVLIAYLADLVVENKANKATRDRLVEHAEAIRAKP